MDQNKATFPLFFILLFFITSLYLDDIYLRRKKQKKKRVLHVFSNECQAKNEDPHARGKLESQTGLS